MRELFIKISNYLLKTCFFIFIVGNGVILPLYFYDGYYDIMESKALCYFYISIIIVLLLIVVIVNNTINLDITFYKDPLLLCITVFCAFSFLSSLISYSPLKSIFGTQGWYIGSYVLITIMVSILCLSRYKLKNEKIFIPVIIAILIILIIGIADAFELDILNMRDENYAINYHSYISTIGNINWFVGYLSLILPLFCGLYLNEGNDKRKKMYFVLSILSIMNLAFLKSDGIYLALGFLSFFIIPFIFDNLERIKRFSYLLFTYSICLIVSRLINLGMDGYCAYFREWYVIIPLLVLSIYIYSYSTSTKNSKYNKYKSKLIMCIEILLFISCITLLILIFMNADMSWGNGRLIIWRKSFESFKDFSIKNKLFGVGPELLYNIYSSLFDEFGYVLCSHSEPIQVLLSMGIFGFISYVLCWIYFFIKYHNNDNKKIIPLYFGIICYFAQSFVNSTTTLNLATLAIFIILIYVFNNK